MTPDMAIRGAASLGTILVAAGAGIVAVEGRRRHPVLESVLTRRWLTWAVLAPMWLAASVWPVARAVLLTAFAAIAVSEFARMRTALVRADRWILTGWALVSVPLVALGADLTPVIVAASLTTIVLPLMTSDIRNGPQRIGDACFGLVIVVVPFLLLVEIASRTSGAVFFALGMAIALSDVCAFVMGSTLGKRRLTPALSPNKTVAGVVGNFLGATLGVAISVAAGIVPLSVGWLAPIVAIGAIIGDLTISLLKRSHGVKDAGNWLPGFGGLLDRVDSLLVATPIAYAAISIFGVGS
jgi:phosphatidate cytidylyltransferase